MTKEETFYILKEIQREYNTFMVNQNVIDAWYEIIKKHSLEKVEKRLAEYKRTSKFPPSLMEFASPLQSFSTTPDVNETMRLINREKPTASKEAREQACASMRVILGMPRGEN